MKLFNLIAVLLFASSAFANSVDSKFSPRLPNFAAPVVPASSGVTNAQVGSIVFDSGANAFKGLDQSGNWDAFGPAPQSGAKIGFVTVTPTSSGSSWTTVPFTSANANWDTNSYVGTNVFTVPTSGLYMLNLIAYYNNTGSGAEVIGLAYTINSNPVKAFTDRTIQNGEYTVMNGTAVEKLTAGDTVIFQVTDTFNLTFQNIEASMTKF